MSVIPALISHSSGRSSGPAYTPPAGAEDFVKRFRALPYTGDLYRSFPTALDLGTGIAVLYHLGIPTLEGGVLSYAHLWKGDTGQAIISAVTGEAGAEQTIDTEADRDISDVYGSRLDDGSYVYGSSLSPVAIKQLAYGKQFNPAMGSYEAPLPGNAEPFIRIAADDSLNWGPRRNLFTDPGAINPPAEQRSCTLYGSPTPGANPGEYYWSFITFDYGEGGVTPNNNGYVIYTADYFSTWEFIPQWSATGVSETASAFIPGYGLMSIRRIDQSGRVQAFFQPIGSPTFSFRGDLNVRMYDISTASIIAVEVTPAGLVNLWLNIRGVGYLCCSRNNDPAVFFDQANPPFNPFEMYFRTNKNEEEDYYNLTHDNNGNPSLGYQAIIRRADGSYFVLVGKEVNEHKAQLYYTFHADLDVDPAGIPVAPTLGVPAHFLGSTRLRLSIMGLTSAQQQNIREFRVWIAEDADFTIFPNLTFNTNNSDADHLSSPVNDERIIGQSLTIYGFAPSTTYYFKAISRNNAGDSVVSLYNVTTNASGNPF